MIPKREKKTDSSSSNEDLVLIMKKRGFDGFNSYNSWNYATVGAGCMLGCQWGRSRHFYRCKCIICEDKSATTRRLLNQSNILQSIWVVLVVVGDNDNNNWITKGLFIRNVILAFYVKIQTVWETFFPCEFFEWKKKMHPLCKSP